MTTDLCAEDVVVRITNQEILSTEDATVSLETNDGGDSSMVGGGGTSVQVEGVVGAGGVGGGGASTAMELGRRLLQAARVGDTPLVLDLMAKGAPFASDWLGTSPLHLAASNAHLQTCGVLLRAGVSRDSRTKVERTPLHLAAHAGHAPVAALLLVHGARVDCRDMLRMTPLHWAAERGHAQVVRVLLNYGADVRAVSKFNKQPAELAAARGHLDVAALLEDALRAREAARSVRALVSERLADEPSEPQQPAFATVQRIQDIKINKPKFTQEKMAKTETKAEKVEENNENAAVGEGAAAQLLRRHGITLLPPDPGGTVLRALQAGRTCVLSDAGKIMLKESHAPTGGASLGGAGGGRGRGGGGGGGRVVVRAGGVRVLALNNRPGGGGGGGGGAGAHKLLAKIVNPHDLQQQVKIVQLPDTRFVSPKVVKEKSRVGRPPAPRPPVKIIMNKSNFQRLLSGAARIDLSNNVPTVENTIEPEPVLEVSEVGTSADDNSDNSDLLTLRCQLAASQRVVARLTEELRQCRARLAQYEQQ